MRPTCQITIDGQPASSVLMERVMQCEVVDKEGLSSDTVSIELNDSPPAALPRRGAIVGVRMGYGEAMAHMGEFSAEEIEARTFPFTLRVVGTSAAMGADRKAIKERHWDDASLGKIVEQIAGEYGLTPAVDPVLGGFTYPWVGQVGESDLAFLERLAGRHDAIFAIKQAHLIFAKKGTGRAPSGAALTPVIVTPQTMVAGSMGVRWIERSRFGSVVATYMDRAAGQKAEVSVPSAPESEAEYRISEPFGTREEAEEAAKAKAAELLRRQITFDVAIVGDPTARAGAPLQFQGVRLGVDGMPFIIETARHRYSPSGYTTVLSGHVQE